MRENKYKAVCCQAAQNFPQNTAGHKGISGEVAGEGQGAMERGTQEELAIYLLDLSCVYSLPPWYKCPYTSWLSSFAPSRGTVRASVSTSPV